MNFSDSVSSAWTSIHAFTAKAVEFVQRPEFQIEAAKGTPAVVATAWTRDDVVTFATVVYIVLQAAYLLRKWYREEKKGGQK